MSRARAGLKTTTKILSIDKGWKQLEFNAAANREPMGVAVGILREQGNNIHKESGLTVYEIAHIHEKGRMDHTPPIPRRSFLFDAVDGFTFMNSRVFAEQVGSILYGGGSRLGVLMLMGERALAQVKARMRAGIDPPLSQKAIDKKKAKGRFTLTALFDSKQLYNSLSFKIGPRSMFFDGGEDQ